GGRIRGVDEERGGRGELARRRAAELGTQSGHQVEIGHDAPAIRIGAADDHAVHSASASSVSPRAGDAATGARLRTRMPAGTIAARASANIAASSSGTGASGRWT